MSFEIPQQAKYRLTGGIILVTFAIFVMPGLMKKSNQRFEESIAKHLSVPAKPRAPSLSIPSRSEVFEAVRPHAPIVEPKIAERQIEMEVSKAKPLELSESLVQPVVAKAPKQVAQINQQKLLPAVKLDKPSTPKKAKQIAVEKHLTPARVQPKQVASGKYMVQLASFSHQENADFLLSRLKKMGYPAQVFKIKGSQGAFYQVVVGHLASKENALFLQKRLAQNLQLQGFIVNREVG